MKQIWCTPKIETVQQTSFIFTGPITSDTQATTCERQGGREEERERERERENSFTEQYLLLQLTSLHSKSTL